MKTQSQIQLFLYKYMKSD